MKKSPLILLLGVIIAVAVLHILGLKFYFYWRFGWYDTVVHILGAFFVATAVLYYFSSSVTLPNLSTTKIFIIGLASALVIGIIWELFEVKIGATFVTRPEYIPDTIGDLLSDIVGGILGSLYSLRLIRSAWLEK
jgi:hypothetical protein